MKVSIRRLVPVFGAAMSLCVTAHAIADNTQEQGEERRSGGLLDFLADVAEAAEVLEEIQTYDTGASDKPDARKPAGFDNANACLEHRASGQVYPANIDMVSGEQLNESTGRLAYGMYNRYAIQRWSATDVTMIQLEGGTFYGLEVPQDPTDGEDAEGEEWTVWAINPITGCSR